MTRQLIRCDDLNFLLHHWLRAEAIADRDTVDAILDLSEKLATDAFLTPGSARQCDAVSFVIRPCRAGVASAAPVPIF